MQLVDNRIDLSLPSDSPAPPDDVQVAQLAEPQIKQQLAAGALWWGLRSYNVTNIEYRETVAVRKTSSGWDSPPARRASSSPSAGDGRRFCGQCGAPIPQGSVFCGKCGARA